MGAKTGILAYVDGDLPSILRTVPPPPPAATEALVRRLFPDWTMVGAVEAGVLSDEVYPTEGITYAAAFPGADILCDRRFMLYDKPSELPRSLIDAARGRRLILHAMHSVSDWLAFAVWEDGRLVRSLSLSPEDGVIENIGRPFPFEAEYWAGKKPVESSLGDEPYPLPFHPLELGEEVLLALFGFQLEGFPDANPVDAEAVPLLGFRMTDPGEESRRAEMARLMAALGLPARR